VKRSLKHFNSATYLPSGMKPARRDAEGATPGVESVRVPHFKMDQGGNMRKSQKHALLAAFVAALAFAGLAHGQTQLVVSPTSLTMTVNTSAGTSFSSPQCLTLASGDGSAIPYSYIVESISPPGPWFTTGPVSNAPLLTPGSICVYSVFRGLPLPYSGTISITSPVASSVVVPITAVQQGSPVTVQQTSSGIASVLNAASFANASMSPGEVVSIFGTGLGPAVPLGAQLDSAGRVSTSLGGVQVYFYNESPEGSCCGLSAVQAPLTYVSETQINCVVPYDPVPQFVDVYYLNAWSKPAAPDIKLTAYSPGIFTAMGTGTGQAAALNSDNTPNTTSNPAPAGSVVQVWMTGEGQTSPAGVTGSVTCSNGCATTSQIPKPVAPVAAFVNDQPATITFYGEAPGLVSGVMQVNVVVPPYTRSGAASLSITVGSWAYSTSGPGSTQAGVTIAVK
jgi:uncharacterized protein (TIGR03437 family)